MATIFSLTFSIFLAILCATATALRFVASKRILGRLSAEDWLAFAALVSCLTHIGFGLTNSIISHDGFYPDGYVRSQKIAYASTPFYPLNQFFTKSSILFFYHRIFSVKKSFARWIYILGIAQAVLTILTIFINLFICHPINYYWDLWVIGSCMDQITINRATESVNSAIDFAMVALAFVMVSGIRLALSTKLKLLLLFVIGSLSGLIGFIRIGNGNVVWRAKDSPSFHGADYSWALGQQATSIICCCAPMYKGAFHPYEFCAKLATRARQYTCWRRKVSPLDEPNDGQVWLALDDFSV
ncbi:putative integral membrane protein [Rosellinia necatrix]|uniref:Putative integral membrane protein n=1 Tax=Rosellinia necatrix TaxID=77044 RepID=A0A1W2TI65_ROSNE|nr:putative integral membrane protein [Rosellinia necatrix]